MGEVDHTSHKKGLVSIVLLYPCASWELIFPLRVLSDARQQKSVVRPPQTAQKHSSDSPLGFGSWGVGF